MTPLLRQVARAYAGSHTPDQLSDICFIFPNKRSATFFLRYLDLEMACPHIEPEATTIGEFLASLSPLAEAPRFMQLSTLYDAYRTIAPDSAPDFDRFMFWGEILLADFADVDRYMVNSAELFSNIEELARSTRPISPTPSATSYADTGARTLPASTGSPTPKATRPSASGPTSTAPALTTTLRNS